MTDFFSLFFLNSLTFINIHGYNVSTTYAARQNQLNASRTNWITRFVYEEANISSRPR